MTTKPDTYKLTPQQIAAAVHILKAAGLYGSPAFHCSVVDDQDVVFPAPLQPTCTSRANVNIVTSPAPTKNLSIICFIFLTPSGLVNVLA
jgi:hypothetical protein